ncbi:MAG: L-threonylcarbamoyladenylate synthase [Candidatus Heimdallarchaeota archaeon]
MALGKFPIRIAITNPQIVPLASETLGNGVIGVFPTDTCYGLGCCGLKWNSDNIYRIFRLKERPLDLPLSLLISKDMIPKYIVATPQFYSFLHEIWQLSEPSPTLILKCRKGAVSPLLNAKDPLKIAFRVPSYELLVKIIQKAGCPIIGTSANKTGAPVNYSLEGVYQDFLPKDIPLTIDAGHLPPNKPSTIIDLSNLTNPVVIRRGGFDPQRVFERLSEIY